MVVSELEVDGVKRREVDVWSKASSMLVGGA